jgi:hypothetical protein
MGAWSEDTFGNDTACDWVGDFLATPGLTPLREAIDAVLASDEYLDGDEACDCLAGCEVIARSQGRWGLRVSYTEALDSWILNNPLAIPDDLKEAADAAIARILAPNSELLELWDEDGRNDAWHDAVEDLRQRVKG